MSTEAITNQIQQAGQWIAPLRAELRRVLGRLPRRSAAILVMRHGGMSYLEIADALGVNVGQVGTLLRRAESALRKEMDRETHS